MERLVGKYIFDPEMTEGKMIFITGPRQIGKTTFAKNWLGLLGIEGTYFNWDDPSVMAAFKKNPLYFKNIIDRKIDQAPVPMVFDEIHKHKEWRNLLKGFFDTNKERMKLLVTGSARLNVARKSGDSLLGRYFAYQMLPLGLPEVVKDLSHVIKDERPFKNGDLLAGLARKSEKNIIKEAFDLLLKFGGFPEPVLKGSERFHKRWQMEYKTLLIKEDVRDLSRISDIKGIESLVEILPTKIGSNLSVPSISQDLGRKYDTIQNWLELLEGLYMVFMIRPWHKRISRAIKKEKKLYFYDWSMLSDSGSRFENMIAVALLRMAARFSETGLGSYEIRYIRDREKREVDFILIKDNSPVALFEAKESNTHIDKSGMYYCERLKIPLFQIVLKTKTVEAFPRNSYVIPASNFLMLIG